MKWIVNWIRVLRMRHFIRVERRKKGFCANCGQKSKCERWCWGPTVRSYLWVTIKAHKWTTTKFLWRNFRGELRWAGVEPWHRYE